MTGLPLTRLTSLFAEAPASPGLLPSHGLARRLWPGLLDLLFPPRCPACGRVDTRWCARCAAAVEAVPLLADVWRTAPLAGVTATAPHEGLPREAVHALKYAGAREAALPLAARMAAQVAALGWTADAVVPVPLHPARERARGYNQAAVLADRLAERLGLPGVPGALCRSRDTLSQVGLSAAERRANVLDAFSPVPGAPALPSVLLVDDVHTTGATLAACAVALLQAGTARVYAITATVAL